MLDAVADDGIRGGLCLLGDDDGLSCDVAGVNTSFPAFKTGKGGAGHSIDCNPPIGKNISGTGIRISLNKATSVANLASTVSCRGNNSDADCAAQEGSCACSDGKVKCTSDAQCSNAWNASDGRQPC